jgi:hypothetical protein
MNIYFKSAKYFVCTALFFCVLAINKPAFAQAEQKTEPKQQAKEVEPKIAPVYDKQKCDEAKDIIAKQLTEHKNCWKDEDCKMIDFGYPWQTNECLKTIISTSKKDDIIQSFGKIEYYKDYCILTNKDEEKNYKNFEKKLKSARCPYVPLLCLKGVCRTSTYAVIDDAGVNYNIGR